MICGEQYERCLIAALQEAIEERGLKHKPTAEAAWPDQKDAGTRWRKIRNDPRARLNIGDAYDLANTIGVSFLEICGIAQAKYKEQLKSSRLLFQPNILTPAALKVLIAILKKHNRKKQGIMSYLAVD